MRLIDADDLIKAFEALDLMNGQYAESFTSMAGNRSMEIESAINYIENAKTIDTKPIVHAHWIEQEHEGYVVNVLTEDKDLICKELAKLLKLTRNQSDLKALRYEILDNGEEIVTVEWEGGGRKVVCVSMDSGTAMIRDIMRAID